MASSLISGAVALLLILTGGYVIAAGILSIAETTMNSQIEMTAVEEKILQTKLTSLYSEVGESGPPYSLVIGVANNGSTIFGGSDFEKMDLYIYNGSETARYNTSSTKWNYTFVNDRINTKMWDPNEIINVSISVPGNRPLWAKFSTPNGITTSLYL